MCGFVVVNYDIDFGFYMINDYYYEIVDWFYLWVELVSNGFFFDSDNIFFRGKNIYLFGVSCGGFYDCFIFIFGKKYFFCFINVSVDNFFVIFFVGYNFIVIMNDFVLVNLVVCFFFFMVVG